MPSITIGLAGNPNSGKTTVFNAITGAHQHVGNYPGVTVETKDGLRRHGDYDVRVVDLPGTYSLTAYSAEELVARNFVVNERPDVIVDVVDASNLERNLYLATQFIELDQPTVIALNMMDMAEQSGKDIDHELLAELLGIPIVPMVASKEEGVEELLDTVIAVAKEKRDPSVQMNFGPELEPHIHELTDLIEGAEWETPSPAGPPSDPDERRVDGRLSSRWIAIKLLEDDSEVERLVAERAPGSGELLHAATRAREHISQVVGDDAEIAIADRRYGFATGAVRQALHHDQLHRVDWSDAVDRIVVSRILGLPIFAVFMWAMFVMVFRLGAPPMEWIESFFGLLGEVVGDLLPEGTLRSLIVDGIIGGVGGVLVFVPNIMLLFLGISILEDTGYMARAAFVVDRIMHRIGLHGKSFIPLLIGFGCTVPAVMATRTLDQRRDRLVTMLVAPLMSCGAKLPVYILLAGAFFAPAVAGHVIFSIYVIGVLLAIVMAFVFRKVLLTGPTTPFVMELPPYRLPTVKGLAIHVWERAWQYIKKAGTIILGFAIIMWFLMSYPHIPEAHLTGLSDVQAAEQAAAYTFAGRMGKTIEPVLRPLGFNWKVGIALIAGFGAKEVVVSTLATAYSLEGEDEEAPDLRAALVNDPDFSPLVAYTLMIFVLIYIPCMAAVAVIYREANSWKWPLFTILYTTTLAWIASFIVFNLGKLLGYG